LVTTVSPAATGVPLPATRVCSTSCFGGWLAGKVTVGFVLKAPVTLIPVFSTTGASSEVDGCDDELEAALGEWELDEQALNEMATASTDASRAGRTSERARAGSPLDSVPSFIDSIPSSARQLDEA
jgi:hypothetical protein